MSVTTVTLSDAAARLQELVTRASQGEQIVIAQNEQPLAKLVPFAEVEGDRIFGQARGRVHVSEDFDGPLPDDFWLGRSSEVTRYGKGELGSLVGRWDDGDELAKELDRVVARRRPGDQR